MLTPIPSAPTTLADALREQTKAAHTRAERHPQQGRLVKGESSRQEYAAWLGQMLHLWRALDRALVAKAGSDPRVAAMVRPHHTHAPRLEDDLDFLGVKADDFPPLGATKAFVDHIDAARDAKGPALLGIWYVLEGSANGGQYIAKAVAKSLNIPGPRGLSSLDPHGSAQRERWQIWRTDLNGQPWDESEHRAIIEAAIVTFDDVFAMLEDLEAHERGPH